MSDKLIVAAYGLFLIAGAFFGLKAGSKVSLIMGLVSGALVFVGFYLMQVNLRHGFLFLSLLGGSLGIVFLMRFLKTQKIMPGGMLLALTILFFAFCLWRYTKS